MSIEAELKNGDFVVGECTYCKKTIWPPADYCDRCLSTVSVKKGPPEGKIIEFSRQKDSYFCLVEFEKEMRIMGKFLQGTPIKNQPVKVEKCGINDEGYFFEFTPV